MLIRVQYVGGSFDLVKPFILDSLIRSGRITGFQRSGGWAVIGRDPVRQTSSTVSSPEPERRAHHFPFGEGRLAG